MEVTDFREFRNGRSPILVATDVAARGLDVEDVKYVINFDYPNSSEDYIHRIGRTGRCDQPGTAYTFFTPNNQRQAKELIAVLTEADQPINSKLAELAALAKASYSSRNRWNNRNKENSSVNSRTNTSNWNLTSNGTNNQEYRQLAQPNRFHNNSTGTSNQGTRNNYHKNNSHCSTYGYTQNGYQNGYGHQVSTYQQQNGYSQGSYGGQQTVPYAQNRNYSTSGQRTNSGYQGQKYTRQNYSDTQGQGVYSVPPPFMMQHSSEAGVQTLINHKFFQPNRPPPQNNPCAYQNGYAAQYHQAALPYTYSFSQPQAVQQ